MRPTDADESAESEEDIVGKKGLCSRFKACFGKYWKGFLLILTLTLIGVLVSSLLQDEITDAVEFLKENGPLGIFLYVLAFIILLQVGVPSTVMEIASAFLFDEFYQLVLINLFAKNIAKSLGFVIGKYLIHDFVKKNLMDSELAVVRALELLIKRSPLRYATLWGFAYIPSWTQMYGLPVMGCSFLIYTISHNISGVVYSLMWAFVGIRTRETVDEVQEGEDIEAIEISATIIGIVFLLLSVVLVGYYVKKEINKEAEDLQRSNAAPQEPVRTVNEEATPASNSVVTV